MPFNKFNHYEPRFTQDYKNKAPEKCCEFVTLPQRTKCSSNVSSANDGQCCECGIIACYIHLNKRYQGYKVCARCYANLNILFRLAFNRINNNILTNHTHLNNFENKLLTSMYKFMPESALLAQKHKGSSLFYKTERGSRYFYKFTDNTPIFRRVISDEVGIGRRYDSVDLHSTDRLVSSYSNIDYRILKKTVGLKDPIVKNSKNRSTSYKLLNSYYAGFQETEVPGIYKKVYIVDAAIYYIEHDALFTNTAFDAIDDDGNHLHCGDRVVYSQFF